MKHNLKKFLSVTLSIIFMLSVVSSKASALENTSSSNDILIEDNFVFANDGLANEIRPFATYASYFSVNPPAAATGSYEYYGYMPGTIYLDKKISEYLTGEIEELMEDALPDIPANIAASVFNSAANEFKSLALTYGSEYETANSIYYVRYVYRNTSQRPLQYFYRHDITFTFVDRSESVNSVYETEILC